jgi:hypothetical protein
LFSPFASRHAQFKSFALKTDYEQSGAVCEFDYQLILSMSPHAFHRLAAKKSAKLALLFFQRHSYAASAAIF